MATEQRGPSSRSLQLVDLPPEVLDAIFGHLLKTKEPLRALPLVCRKLRDATRASPQLWRAVGLALDATQQRGWRGRLESFLRWLGPRAAHVQALSLRLELPESPEVRAAAWALVTDILSTVRTTLKELELSWPGTLTVSDWLAALPALTSAAVEGRALEFLPAVAEAGSLRRLAIALPGRGPGLRFAKPGCLPPGLEGLDLFGIGLRALPRGQLEALRVLRSLDLSSNPRLPASELDAFAYLTALEELGYSQNAQPQLPPQLSHLTGLRVLYLHGCLAEPPPPAEMHAQFEALRPLCRLAMLSISGNALPELPAAVAALTTLRCLHIEGNPTLQLPPGPYLAGLVELAIDWNTLFGSHALLPARASALLKLFAVGSHALGEDGAAAGPGTVARALASCPRLAHFVDVLPEGSSAGLDLEVAQLMYMLPAACPRLRVTASAADDFGYTLATLPAEWRF